jgi:hypothetical protein
MKRRAALPRVAGHAEVTHHTQRPNGGRSMNRVLLPQRSYRGPSRRYTSSPWFNAFTPHAGTCYSPASALPLEGTGREEDPSSQARGRTVTNHETKNAETVAPPGGNGNRTALHDVVELHDRPHAYPSLISLGRGVFERRSRKRSDRPRPDTRASLALLVAALPLSTAAGKCRRRGRIARPTSRTLWNHRWRHRR